MASYNICPDIPKKQDETGCRRSCHDCRHLQGFSSYLFQDIQCDNGGEFKGEVTKLLEKHEVKIRRVTTKYKHTHTAFIEALNKILAEQLFKVQDAQELNDHEKVSYSYMD